ncbi:hypothetical protein B0H17DRAFT_38643 [Mycena rosella]|uniref:F-box domain-containing protein n=1 Tax=Mycena rosella TaxID=1033263 RepID=A0AAD7GRT1_MYCRO|nr:hypothetical protein B0H17DRAFT_38643 [Mycena rosella]
MTASSGAASAPNIPDLAERMRIRALLRSNSQPPAQIHSKISELLAELARFDVQIAKLQAELDQLAARRAPFQAHYDDCYGLIAPIRRLPSEILVEIFRLCWLEPVADVDESALAMKRLANAPLLALSQVCSRWHTIALGTPALWSVIEIDSLIWSEPTVKVDTAMGLLRSVLERGANHPLVVTIRNLDGGQLYGPALELLARHSVRWRSAILTGPLAPLRHLSGAKNNLPQLESLMFYCWPWETPETTPFELFQVAPSLARLELAGNVDNFPVLSNFPFEQLDRLECAEQIGPLPAFFTTTISRLSRTSTLSLRLCLTSPGDLFHIPSATSNVAFLDIDVPWDIPTSAQQLLHQLFASLTLPFLERLGFQTTEPPPVALPWPHPQFLSLSQRSAFHTHLFELLLDDVAIADTELIECLATLPALEHLSIADHKSGTQGEHVLITDTLWAALMRTPSSKACLVPRLCFLEFQTLLKFDEKILLTCVESRAYGMPPDLDIFDSALLSIAEPDRDFGPATWLRIEELWWEVGMGFTFAGEKK